MSNCVYRPARKKERAAAASRLEQQSQRIAELEAENREIRQNSISHATHAEFVSDYREQIDERDAKIAELNDFQNSQCAKLLVRNGELERELAAAKEDIVAMLKSCENCTYCKKECNIEDECKPEWRGAREGEGK